MRNRSCIHSVSFGLSKAEAFPIKVCAQGIQDIGEQTIVKKKPQQVVAVMSGRLKPYFYFVLCNRQWNPSMVFGMVNTSARTSPSELTMKQSCLSFETSIPTETTIAKTSRVRFVMLHPQDTLLL